MYFESCVFGKKHGKNHDRSQGVYKNRQNNNGGLSKSSKLTISLSSFLITQRTQNSHTFHKMAYMYHISVKTACNPTIKLVFQNAFIYSFFPLMKVHRGSIAGISS